MHQFIGTSILSGETRADPKCTGSSRRWLIDCDLSHVKVLVAFRLLMLVQSFSADTFNFAGCAACTGSPSAGAVCRRSLCVLCGHVFLLASVRCTSFRNQPQPSKSNEIILCRVVAAFIVRHKKAPYYSMLDAIACKRDLFRKQR